MHKILDVFEFRPDRTTDYGVSCPRAPKKFPMDLQLENGIYMLARSFLFESSSNLLVTRAGIKAWSGLILGRFRPFILELLALEWRKFHTFEFEYLKPVGQSWSNFMCSIIGVGESLHKVLGQIDLGTLDSGERSLPFGLLAKFYGLIFKWVSVLYFFLEQN